MATKKFIVTIQEVHTVDVEIKAETPEEARAKVSHKYNNCDVSLEGLSYSHTFPTSEWKSVEKTK
jgi:DpnD/PcfM-like protein